MNGPKDYRTKQKTTHDITYLWNLKYDTNEHIYETEIDSQIQRTDLWLPWLGWGRDELGVWDQQMQAIMYKMDKEQGPTESHRKLIKYLVINQNGKEYEKEYLYIYIYIYVYI